MCRSTSVGPCAAHTSQTMCTHVHNSWTKQTVLALFNLRGLIYMHIIPRGTINATYIIKPLGQFLEHFKKRPAMAHQQWWFSWENTSPYGR